MSKLISTPVLLPIQLFCIVRILSGQSTSPLKVHQTVGIVGDAEEPLLQVSAGDDSPATLAGPVQHLLIGPAR